MFQQSNINLEDIILQYLEENKQISIRINQIPIIKHCMKLAISQALVLASEKATAKAKFIDYDEAIGVVDKQSILDVDKLVI